ncbi:urease accessory protein UreE [Pseudomethylobacillus aquaticus]|uniref:Urease accessory protein UreE n=1 Tax=Pseudomethylobacillus aquaticus TaxID=2676064 RepID=A0A3N0V0P2_9PROT|nr:urease accessory protein UreE [Pseudomethylobacillus aquaticus]ROH86172.1 urease accessory protein UreE [Pseudomethylobacillus aquaticus]
MIHLIEVLPAGSEPRIDDAVALPFDLRQKSRLRLTLRSGREAALFVARGTILRGGDLLRAEDGMIVEVQAAPQAVMDVYADSAQALTCAAYHLGNRHVPLQVGPDWLRLEQDHVLKDMLHGLGVQVRDWQAPFEPEAGAYGSGHRHHGDEEAPSLRPILRLKKPA